MLSKASRFVLIALLSAFVAAVLLDPEDYIRHLHLFLLTLVVAVWAVRVACRLVSPGGLKMWAAILLFAVVLPGMAAIIGLLGHSYTTDELRYQIQKYLIVVLLIPVISSEGIDLTKHIFRWSFFIAVIPIALVVAIIFVPSFFFVVFSFTFEKGAMLVRPTHDTIAQGTQSFYYQTVNVAVFPIAYYLRNLLNGPKKIVNCMLVLLFVMAVLGSGSRAAVLGAFMVVAALIYQKLKTKYGFGTAFAALLILVILSGAYFVGFFRPDESSNAAKLGHIRSYMEEFETHPTYLLWGQGTDTVFYDQTWQDKVPLTELTYIDMIRWFGMPVSALMFAALLFPAVALLRRRTADSYLAVPYAVYLWESATNPLLICWAGLLVVSAIWGLVLMQTGRQSPASGALQRELLGSVQTLDGDMSRFAPNLDNPSSLRE
jgi:hypothetical protein